MKFNGIYNILKTISKCYFELGNDLMNNVNDHLKIKYSQHPKQEKLLFIILLQIYLSY